MQRHDLATFAARLGGRWVSQSAAPGAALVRIGQPGTSSEGRKLPLIILADPPVATPDEAAKSDFREMTWLDPNS